jgi:hypothetical protein
MLRIEKRLVLIQEAECDSSRGSNLTRASNLTPNPFPLGKGTGREKIRVRRIEQKQNSLQMKFWFPFPSGKGLGVVRTGKEGNRLDR